MKATEGPLISFNGKMLTRSQLFTSSYMIGAIFDDFILH